MRDIQFDSGLKSYRINGGEVLRFNPCDPNLYTRFLESVEKLKELEGELMAQACDVQGEELVTLLSEADRKMKELLNWVFGGENDFQKLLKGVNLLAVAENGERVITNFFEALEPVLIDGAKRCARQEAVKSRTGE